MLPTVDEDGRKTKFPFVSYFKLIFNSARAIKRGGIGPRKPPLLGLVSMIQAAGRGGACLSSFGLRFV